LSYEAEEKAANRVAAMLASTDIQIGGETFQPWDLFPSVLGTYNGEFDKLAVEVLKDIRDGTHHRDDLANEIFREMLCTANLCTYGVSPSGCFATEPFKKILPSLIDRWEKYQNHMWR
jgi:hypothetical protein